MFKCATLVSYFKIKRKKCKYRECIFTFNSASIIPADGRGGGVLRVKIRLHEFLVLIVLVLGTVNDGIVAAN
jgi:hypothetical protein